MQRCIFILLCTVVFYLTHAEYLEIEDNRHRLVLSYQANKITLLEVGFQGELDTVVTVTHEDDIKKIQVLPDKKSFYVLHQDKEGTFSGGQVHYTYIDVTTMYRYEDGYIIKVFKKRNVNLLGHIVLKEYIIRENGLIYSIDEEFVQSKYPISSLFAMRAKNNYPNIPDSTYQRLKQGKTFGSPNEIYTVLRVVDNETKIIVEKKHEGAGRKGTQILLLEFNPDFVIGNELGRIDYKANHENIVWSPKTKSFYYCEEEDNPSVVHSISWANNTLTELGKHPIKLHNIVVSELHSFLMGIDKNHMLQFFIIDNKGLLALTSSYTCKDKENTVNNPILSHFTVVTYENGINVLVGFGKPSKEANQMLYFYALLTTTGESTSWKAHQFSYIDKKSIQFIDIESGY
ncbi:MAG: hypothetical protein NZ455_13275 [Bacteroidia bacterium]|nr:hypothetical protein [Bacteroidia bacterium]MDW8348109.1 hypothetical protein [Bacteroidia bacterium]